MEEQRLLCLLTRLTEFTADSSVQVLRQYGLIEAHPSILPNYFLLEKYENQLRTHDESAPSPRHTG